MHTLFLNITTSIICICSQQLRHANRMYQKNFPYREFHVIWIFQNIQDIFHHHRIESGDSCYIWYKNHFEEYRLA